MRTGLTRILLIATAVAEGPLGLTLLVLPAVPFELLFGVKHSATEALFIGRIAGAALLAIGIASWCARRDPGTPAQLGLIVGLLVYNITTGVLLGYAGLMLSMKGVALWPGIFAHVVLAVGCIVALVRACSRIPA